MNSLSYSTDMILQWIFVGIILLSVIIFFAKWVIRKIMRRNQAGKTACDNCPESQSCSSASKKK
ncbi:MAG: hypothetical protein K2M98_02815 [Muribaculum sp.]|nr:hypothetical protein [Muribaculum sp.]